MPGQRICHLSKYYPPSSGGIESHVQILALQQAKLGNEVTVICVNDRNARGEASRTTATAAEWDEQVKVVRLGRLLNLARVDVCPGFLSKAWYRYIWECDIVHIHTPNPAMLAFWGLSSLTCGQLSSPEKRLIVTHHSDAIKQRLLKYLVRPLEYAIYSQCHHILTTSPRYLEGSKFLKVFERKVSPLPLGLETSRFEQPSAGALAFAEQLQQQYGSPLWLFVGRLVYYKALDVAIAALSQVPGTLYVIGTGELAEALQRQARQAGVSDRVVWHGRASDDEVVGAYRAATALWLPSNQRSEGFGMVQLEAMSSGCPTINADIPGSGVSWVARNEIEALTVPRSNPDAFARAANRLLAEAGLRERLSAAGRQRVQEFDAGLMAEHSLTLYRQAERSPWHLVRDARDGDLA